MRSFRYNPTAGNGTATGFVATFTDSSTKAWREYIRFATLPNADCILHWFSYGGSLAGYAFKVADSKIYSAVNIGGVTTFGASGVSVTTGIWYRIDAKTVGSVITGTADVQVDGAVCGQATGAFVAATAVGANRGSGAVNITADIFFEDYIASETAADYPIGAGYVLSYIPNADGAHNVASSADFKKGTNATPAGVDITNATTDAYQWIDERPLPTTSVDFINGIAPVNPTDYVEWQYEDSAEAVAPRTVEAIVVYHDASGAGTHNFSVTLREHAGGTTADIMAAATRNVGATITYARKHFATVPGTSDPWTDTKFDALRSRFLVSDASPDPYIDAAMLEAEFAEPVVTGAPATRIVRQAVKRAAYY